MDRPVGLPHRSTVATLGQLSTLFLCGDVMTGRAIDQILPHPGDPRLLEPWMADARDYVELAERAHGPVPAPVDPAYPWGDALAELERFQPDARIINLETTVTTSDDFWPGKPVHYRMHPANVDCLTTAGPLLCALANNHILDLGEQGLLETLATLHRAGLRTAGAGRTLAEARAPATAQLPAGGRLLLFSFGSQTSGIPAAWAASDLRPGIDLLPDLSDATAAEVTARIGRLRSPGSLVVASVHWGSNWGYEVPAEQVRFAHRLVDGGVDVVHGHSSHHPRPIEVYRERLVVHGAGDFLNDYEGIGGHEGLRGDLTLMFLVTVEVETGRLVELRLMPFRTERLRLARTDARDTSWLARRLDRIGRPFGTQVAEDRHGLRVRWE